MASLVSKRIDETGACLMLGIKPKSWFNWKYHAKNKEQFAEVLTHVREAKLNACLEAIDEAGDGKIDTATGTVIQRADWRAKAWLAERVLAPERYAQKPQEPQQNQPLMAIISSEVASGIFGQLLAPKEPKALPEASKEPATIDMKP